MHDKMLVMGRFLVMKLFIFLLMHLFQFTVPFIAGLYLSLPSPHI
jgi:hypothetical protein